MTRAAPRAAQQYDPLGALGSRLLAIVVGVAAVVWAAVASLTSRDVPGSPTLSTLTVLLVAGAVGVLVLGSSPFRAPFTRTAFSIQFTLLGIAAVTSVAAQWGPDRVALNDFMTLVTAVGVLVASPYRPWRDLLVGGVLLAAVDAASWGLAAASFPTGVPVTVAALLAAAPTLVVTVGAVVFSSMFVTLAERVQIRAGSYSVERADRDGIAASVQQDRATILARDVAPFFDALRSRTAITDADRERARQISDGIRRVMVADADRTWLAQALRAEGADAVSIEDPDASISAMGIDQRTVVRTFLRAVIGASSVDPAGVRIVVERTAGSDGGAAGEARVQVRIEVQVADSDVGIHRSFDPYLAVLRVAFPDLDAAVRPSSLALRFSYDQH